jgi:ActR/RegA family two-component response regulator
MLSGYSITEDIQNAIDHGLILKYFQKPANFSEIDDVIQKELNTMD